MRIVAAAVHHGATVSLPPPARHHTILQSMDMIMGIDTTKVQPSEQGFITDEGRFVNRVEAFYIAWKADQLMKPTNGPELFSEDLW